MGTAGAPPPPPRVVVPRVGRLLPACRVVGEDVAIRRRGQARVGDPARASSLLGVTARGGLVAAAVVGALQGGWVGAVWFPIKLFVVPFLMFVQIIGWTVYVHHVSPDIRWWPRREWSQFKGQMESTTILRFPRLVNRLWFHNIFVHVPHHVDARIPFHQLPAAATAISEHVPRHGQGRPLLAGRLPPGGADLQALRLRRRSLAAVLDRVVGGPADRRRVPPRRGSRLVRGVGRPRRTLDECAGAPSADESTPCGGRAPRVALGNGGPIPGTGRAGCEAGAWMPNARRSISGFADSWS